LWTRNKEARIYISETIAVCDDDQAPFVCSGGYRQSVSQSVAGTCLRRRRGGVVDGRRWRRASVWKQTPVGRCVCVCPSPTAFLWVTRRTWLSTTDATPGHFPPSPACQPPDLFANPFVGHINIFFFKFDVVRWWQSFWSHVNYRYLYVYRILHIFAL